MFSLIWDIDMLDVNFACNGIGDDSSFEFAKCINLLSEEGASAVDFGADVIEVKSDVVLFVCWRDWEQEISEC